MILVSVYALFIYNFYRVFPVWFAFHSVCFLYFNVCRRSIAKRKSVFHAEWNDAFKIVDWMHLLLYIYIYICVFSLNTKSLALHTPNQIVQPTNRMQSEYNPKVAITHSTDNTSFSSPDGNEFSLWVGKFISLHFHWKTFIFARRNLSSKA